MAEIVDGKLDVHYDTGVEEGKARRNLKRKEKFSKQVKTAVNLIQVNTKINLNYLELYVQFIRESEHWSMFRVGSMSYSPRSGSHT